MEDETSPPEEKGKKLTASPVRLVAYGLMELVIKFIKSRWLPRVLGFLALWFGLDPTLVLLLGIFIEDLMRQEGTKLINRAIA